MRLKLSPQTIITAMLFCAASCAIGGVFLLSGPGWALIAASGILFSLAGLALRGMLRG